MIIDGHAHTYPDQAALRIIQSFTEFHHMEPTAAVGKGTVSDLLSRMKDNNIDYTVIANFAPRKSIEKTNEWTLAICREYSALIPLVSVHPGMPANQVRLYFEAGAKGIKMHTGIQDFEPADSGLEHIYSLCENMNIPITFHCGETSRVHMNDYSEMSHILPVVEAHPGIPFILTHLAAGNPETVLEIARRYPNALFDTSITFTGEHCIYRIHDNTWEDDDQAAALFREIGCDRITFGTDYPFGNAGSDIRRLKRLNLSEREKQMILGENSAGIYKIKEIDTLS